MPYFDDKNNEYWTLNEILIKKGEPVNVYHIKELGQKIFRHKIPYILSEDGKRLYKKEDLFKKLKNLEQQIDEHENPLVELEEFKTKQEEIDIYKPDDTMNVAYSRVNGNSREYIEELSKQNSLIMQYCVANGIKIDYQYKDMCFSHVFNKDKRPGLYSLVEDMFEGKIKNIYMISPDVLSPFFYEFFVGLCDICGVHVEFISNLPTEEGKKSIMTEVITLTEAMKKRFGF